MFTKILFSLIIVWLISIIRRRNSYKQEEIVGFIAVSLISLPVCLAVASGPREWSEATPRAASGWYEYGELYALTVNWNHDTNSDPTYNVATYFSKTLPTETKLMVGRGKNMFGMRVNDSHRVEHNGEEYEHE